MKPTSSKMLAALACSLVPFALSSAATPQSSAFSPTDPLGKFVGSGTCTGEIMAMGKNPGRAITGKLHSEMDLDGHWVAIHFAEDRTAGSRKPFSIVQYIGYDPAKKHYVTVMFDNTGSGYITGTSPGWEGDSITFEESVLMRDGKHVASRDTFTSKANGTMSHTGWMKDASGQWIKGEVETCHIES